MIRIILEEEEIIKKVEFVDDDKYYGFQTLSGDEKGFITRERYEDGKYKILAANKLTKGNAYSHCSSEDLSGCIRKFIQSGNSKVFEFDTATKLFEWLAAK